MTDPTPANRQRFAPSRDRGVLSRFGPFVAGIAFVAGLASLLVFAGYTPIQLTDQLVIGLFTADLALCLILFGLLIVEAWTLWRSWKAGAAGAGLHIRIVGLFSIIAATPAILIAVVGSVTIERSLNPAFMQDVRAFVHNTAQAAQLFRESQCRSLLQEARLTASDLDRGKTMFDADRSLFREYFGSRVRFLGFSVGVLMKRDGTVLDRIDNRPGEDVHVVTPEPVDFEDAQKNELQCLIIEDGKSFVSLVGMKSFENTYLYVARPLDPFAVTFPNEAASLITFYDTFDQQRTTIRIAFATMYVLLALILLLSATWLGLSFATRLVTPIRRLIAATDQVASGNLYVQVPIQKSEGDLAHLGETFNKMTSELRLQQNRLLAASNVIDERRVFTEAVLSGVPAAIIGVDPADRITVVNPSGARLLDGSGEGSGADMIGKSLSEVFPDLVPIVAASRSSRQRIYQSQTALVVAGRERTFNIRIATAISARDEQALVVTLDDITDLVTAQRTSAWADVARRIAHEIKNPLTPIQLSAERLKRKYGKLITQDRDVFDQCTDTIVRQVDDIKRMVDEFSSFARMPRARVEEDDLAECVRQVLFLMRVGHPDLTIEDHLPAEPLPARFDRRLLSQALTNIVKNATEGIAANERPEGEPGRVAVYLSEQPEGLVAIDVVDNGKGFPVENRQRLLEPYMTTRAEGTGLGLPIVAKILEDHGGGIELLDAPDGPGAWVRLWFPRVPPSAPAKAGTEPSSALIH